MSYCVPLAEPERAIGLATEKSWTRLASELNEVARGLFQNQSGKFKKTIRLRCGFDLFGKALNSAWLGNKFNLPAFEKSFAGLRLAFTARVVTTLGAPIRTRSRRTAFWST